MKELLEEINVTTSSEPENGPSCMMTCGLGTVRGAEQEPSFTLTLQVGKSARKKMNKTFLGSRFVSIA